MAQADKTQEPTTDLLHLSAELLADAVRASYARWVRIKDVVPFFFNFIDYLVLSLPESTDIVIAASNDPDLPRISTKFQTLKNVDVSDCEPIWLSDTGPVLWLDPGGHGKRAIVSCVEAVLGQFDSEARARRRLAKILRKAIEKITAYRLKGTPKSQTLCLVRTGAQTESSENTIEEIVQHTQRHLAFAITHGDEAQVFFIRRRACDETPEGFSYQHDSGTPIPCPSRIPPEWVEKLQDDIDLVFHTGFVRLRAIDRETMVLCVPCHFGGIPWLVMCWVIPNTHSGHWQAYTIYRDIVPRLNDAIRLVGQQSFAREMQRLFRSAVDDVHKDVNTIIADVQDNWKHLACIYPVHRPILKERPSSSIASTGDSDLIIPLGDRSFEVDFAPRQSLCPSFASGLQSEGGGAWGTIDEDVIRRDFIIPVLAAFPELQAKLADDLAESVYSIGHPLKHRLGRVRQAVETEFEALNAQPFDLDDARYQCQRMRLFTTSAECTASIMDLMANLCQHRDVSKLDGKFFSRAPYAIGEHFRMILGHSGEAGARTRIEESDLRRLDGLSIQPGDSLRRLFDPFYDDILFELLFNAERHCHPSAKELSVTYEHIPGDVVDVGKALSALIFTNVMREPSFDRLGLTPNQWCRWRTDRRGPKGGLRLLASQLSLTGAGDLFARILEQEGQWLFSLGVSLHGVTQERSETE